ncbi:hypothetical protein [Flavobacterium yafengii]|jgi:hypothetical protein|uniref:hypothetical protein n=1 Tax=Flavobacterium yafengii TaxID=3041253 RepID=UPI0024A7FA30|nr:hypothetical protein [Flavobacterium yafengii]MDI5899532.1 hypothetical protein [Flavobacterium yafengii]
MNKITFEEYKSAIKSQYEENKNVDVSGILLNPTPAQLRNLCLMIFDNSLSKSDENVFKLFFNLKEEQSIRKCIANYDIARFRPIISFLKGEKDSENTTRIELAAILIDFNPRPYNKYLLNGKIDARGKSEASALVEVKKLIESNSDEERKNEKAGATNKGLGKKAVIYLAVLLSLFFMGYTVKGVFFPEKECMMWKEDHYVVVDCLNDNGALGVVIPIDENRMKLKKLDSNEKLNFFNNEKPVVWYCKHDGVVELFNAPGFHPVTEKPLKPITQYIIDKYLKQ